MRGSIPNMPEDERQTLREFPQAGSGKFAGFAPDGLGVEFSPDGLVTNEDDVIERLVAEGVPESEAPGRVAEFEAWGQLAAAKARLLSVDMPDEARGAVEDLVWLTERRAAAAYGIAAHRCNVARAQAEQAYEESSAAKRVFQEARDEIEGLVAFLLRDKGIEVVGHERLEALTRIGA